MAVVFERDSAYLWLWVPSIIISKANILSGQTIELNYLINFTFYRNLLSESINSNKDASNKKMASFRMSMKNGCGI